ncbi:hypothetical protein CDN99_18375 [Roseateles aquatilis]|uniref:Uncharacterized protein n=1 Tax=Roseateles aquatilis TaxID=431061 RepID=A0A246J4Q8_9BURK|nr:hypothetical protein [Roseateles aquatilis]OWQ87563.1 hypothetical protein CDN99_18375 [Roseateles aquatilis]
MRVVAAAVLALGGLASITMSGALAATAAAATSTGASATTPGERPPVIALMAAVGDRITVVRQKPSVGTLLEPYTRRTLKVAGQALNDAALRGLALGVSQESPEAEQVLLRWTANDELMQRLEEARGNERDTMLLDAIIEHLRPVADRQRWDRIEIIVPKYRRYEANGMGTKLQGIGIYTQPLARNIDLIDDSMGPGDDNGTQRVVNPTTGEVVRKSTFVAPFIFFERVTLDARTLHVLARKQQFDATKYNDPMSDERDVSQHLTPAQMAEKLNYLVERSAYQAIRGKGGTVDVTTPVPVQAMPAASGTAR